MTLRPGPEIAEIRRHLAGLKEAPWLSSSRRWWPDYLFHCTDIQNAVSILGFGELLSRTQARLLGRLAVDIASPDIIARTDLESQDYVRLYFRPRTPTQFRNEGFRPVGQRSYDSHCPVPIYFLLDAISVLSRSDCLFTEGNVASGAVPGSRIDELARIPFDLVYHNTWFAPADRDAIIYHRNAEVLVPQRLTLDCVSFIGCRSQAEYETLLRSLPSDTLARWVDKIGVQPGLQLFNNRWTFVERVKMSDESLVFRFNRETETPGPFDARIEITESLSGSKYTWHNSALDAADVLSLSLGNLRTPQTYSVSLWLDDHLAYAGRYQEDYLPF